MRTLLGWGRTPLVRCAVFCPKRRSGLNEVLSSGVPTSYIPGGLGRIFGAPDVSVDVSLGGILDVLFSRGFTLGVTPGTRFVTVDGESSTDVLSHDLPLILIVLTWIGLSFYHALMEHAPG